MFDQGRRRVRRCLGWRGTLRRCRLRLARTLDQLRGERQPCAKHHCAAPAHYTPISPHTRRTFLRNGTHSATPARRFCAETAAPFVYASVSLARKFTRPVQPRQSLRLRPSDSAIAIGNVGNCADWASLRSQADSCDRFGVRESRQRGLFDRSRLRRERLFRWFGESAEGIESVEERSLLRGNAL
jgi:hypothetical protein